MADDLNLAVAFGAETEALDAGTAKAIQDVKAFEKAIDELKGKLDEMTGAISTGFSQMADAMKPPQKEIKDTNKEAGLLETGFARLAAAAVAAFSINMAVNWAQQMGAMAEDLSNLSQRLGINVSELSAWQVVANNAGISAQSMTTAVQAMSRQIDAARGGSEEASLAFQVLGVDIDSTASNSDRLIQIADAFKSMPDGPEKTALAMQVLGRSGAELIPVFNKGSEAIQEEMAVALETGVALSEGFVATALTVDDAFDRVGNATAALSQRMFEDLAPVLADLANGFAQWMVDMQGAEGAIGPLDALITTLSVALKALGVIIGAVGVVINDVWTAALLVLIPPLALLRALIISISRALQGDFGGAMDAWGEEINNAVNAMGAQVENAKRVRANYSEFLGETLGVTDKNKPGELGGATPDEAGMARLEALKEAQAKAAAARAAAEAARRKREMEAAAREAERLAREVASAQIAALDRQQNKVEEDFAAWNDLQFQKMEIVRQVYGEDSRQYQQMLAEQEEAQQEALQRQQNLLFIAADSQRDVMGIKLQADRDTASARLQIERDRIAQMRLLGQISEQEEIAALGAMEQREIEMERRLQTNLFNLEMESLRQSLGALDLKVEERARINAEIERLQAEHNAKMAGLDASAAVQASSTQAQTAQSVLASWQRITQPVGQALGGMFQNLYNGTMSFKDALLQGLDQILFSFVNMGIQMAADWAAQQLMMSAATTAGVATRTAAEATGAATTQAISAETALMQIANNAWVAASGAYAALAGIPIIGPVLAPAAAIAAIGAVLAFAGNIFSAEGGWGQVPKDGMMTKLHENEMVLPAQYANPLRQMLTGWTPASSPRQLAAANAETTGGMSAQSIGSMYKEGDQTFNFAPTANIQNQSLKQQLRTQSREFKAWMQNERRNRVDGKGGN